MPLNLSGNPANVTTPLLATVTALANNGSGAIRVTTSAPHLFGQSGFVLMTAYPAIGYFTISVIDSTHFDLVGSTYTATGTGTARCLSLTPAIQCATDGDTFSQQLSGALSSIQACIDRTQFLQLQATLAGVSGAHVGQAWRSEFSTLHKQGADSALANFIEACTTAANITAINAAGSAYGGTVLANTQVASGNFWQFYKPAYDPNSGAWLLPYALTTGAPLTEVYLAWSFGLDDGNSWTALAGSSGIPSGDSTGVIDAAACGDPANPLVWGACLQANNALLVIADTTYTSGSWSTKASISTTGTVPLSVEMAGIGSRVVVAVGGTSGSLIGLFSGNSSTSFTQIGTVSGVNHQGWALKSNGSTLIALPTLVQATQLWTSPDGITFTSQNISSIVPTGAFPVGLTWSPLTQLWYMVVQQTASEILIYSSPTGASWTLVTPGTGPDVTAADLACLADGLVLTTADGLVPTGSTTASQVFFSPDFGITWYPTTATAPSIFPSNLSSASVGYSRARLAAGPTQILASNSYFGRFSAQAGLPAPI